MVEFSPATREARVRFPASANFLHATILVSFPINRTKGLCSIVFPSRPLFQCLKSQCWFPQKEILTHLNFGEKALTLVLYHFVSYVRLLLCLAEVFGCAQSSS